jgi:carbon-monoxide dehydrogenase iron sulfur subunit
VRLVVDEAVCTGCRCCELACSARNAGEFRPDGARVRITSSREKHASFVGVCIQCAEQPCVEACPVGAIKRDAADGVVRIDHELCTGCLDCVEACPYGGILVDPITSLPMKCDLCGGEPECVQFCRPQALKLA